MPYLGWARYAGTELINNNRAAAYARGVTVMCGCSTVPEAVGDERYTHPAADRAPWFDRAAPESQDFWGVVGLEIKGASKTTLTREFSDLIGDGAIAGSPRREAREVEFKVLLLARTESALSYGIGWLNAALRGSACKEGCGGDTLCLLSGCPEPPPVSAPEQDCLPAPPGGPAPDRAVPHPEPEPEAAPAPERPNQRAPKPPAPAPAPEPAPAPPPPAPEPPPPAPEPAPAPPPAPPAPPAPPPPGANAAPPPAPPGPPPTGEKGPPDPEVARTVYLVGRELGVHDKIMHAAFEAALVESNCRNLDHGDRDSVGVFQQRPSAETWGTKEECLNVNHAAHKFFEKTIANDKKHPEFSAGKLAQATQSSKYPERYDQRGEQAWKLLQDTAASVGVTTPSPAPPPPRPDAHPTPLPPPGPPPPDAQPTPLPDEGGTAPAPAPSTGGEIHSNEPAPSGTNPDTAPGETDEWNPTAAGRDQMRHLYNVALSEFADDDERARLNGAWTATLSFTLKAGTPTWFAHPTTLVDTRTSSATAAPLLRDTVPDYRIDAVARCPEPVDCLAQSPYLAGRGPWGDEPFPGSNPADPVWRDPGYPTDPFPADRAVYLSPGSVTSGWFEKVPIITVYSGHQEMHRVTIRFYANPRGGRPTELDPCDSCSEITLPWIPARTKVQLDGRTQRTEVTCPDRHVETSSVTLYGPLGGLLEWPAFDCGLPMIVELFAQAGTVARDAWYRIQWAEKRDAI